MTNNIRFRTAAKTAGVKLWEVAEKLGMYDSNFSRKLRHELPDEEQDRLIAIVKEISLEHNADRKIN